MSDCKHENTHLGYGFCNSYGCKGIGGYVTCEDCGELLEYDLDYEVCDQNEIDWYENSKWSKDGQLSTRDTKSINIIPDSN